MGVAVSQPATGGYCPAYNIISHCYMEGINHQEPRAVATQATPWYLRQDLYITGQVVFCL